MSKGIQAAVGMDDVDAGFFDAADIEGMGVDELHDDDAKDVFVGKSWLGRPWLLQLWLLEEFRLASLRRDRRGARRYMIHCHKNGNRGSRRRIGIQEG